MADFPDNYFSSVVTDPPYGISFMNRGWDIQVPKIAIWKEVYRVLKPGGFMLVCCGTRTYHHMTMRIEKAGFEIRDMIVWIYATGFPKGINISKAIDKINKVEPQDLGAHPAPNASGWITSAKGAESNARITAPTSDEAKQWKGWNTALKPAAELWAVCRKPLSEPTVARNVLRHGTGGINIDGSRVGTEFTSGGGAQKLWSHYRDGTDPRLKSGTSKKGIYGKYGERTPKPTQTGRWPANVILGHDFDCRKVGLKKIKAAEGGMSKSSLGGKGAKGIYGGGKPTYRHSHGAEDGFEVVEEWECTPECPVEIMDQQGEEQGVHSSGSEKDADYRYTTDDKLGAGIFAGIGGSARIGDSGGASRFFYQAKPDNRERWFYCDKCIAITNKRIEHDDHPENLHYHLTQKPEELMRYLVKLVTPPDGIVLDPFVGSGSTCVGAKLEGIKSIGIERDNIHFGICRVRYRYAGQESLQERPLEGLEF